jgi:hypothetical protein
MDERRVLLCRLNLGHVDICRETRQADTIPPVFKYNDPDKEWVRLGWVQDNVSGWWQPPPPGFVPRDLRYDLWLKMYRKCSYRYFVVFSILSLF